MESTVCLTDVTLSERAGTTEKGASVASDSTETWSLELNERGLQVLYLPSFDILSIDETTWLGKVREPTPTLEVAPASPTSHGEPEQCPQVHSSALQPGQDDERSLEQMQTMVVEEVLKDIETACKLLNIPPGKGPACRVTLHVFIQLYSMINPLVYCHIPCAFVKGYNSGYHLLGAIIL